jgi:transcriptional antiterminator Rof (Rho-off)
MASSSKRRLAGLRFELLAIFHFQRQHPVILAGEFQVVVIIAINVEYLAIDLDGETRELRLDHIASFTHPELGTVVVSGGFSGVLRFVTALKEERAGKSRPESVDYSALTTTAKSAISASLNPATNAFITSACPPLRSPFLYACREVMQIWRI